ncbi:MAG: hypothetical protein K0R62_8179, partial [Nonomuraea muscovyensis]|nr:hypothetical protein [Nonomuraea muscovyensis]
MRGAAPGGPCTIPTMSALSRPRAEDAAAIHELVAACDLAVLGKVDSTLGD